VVDDIRSPVDPVPHQALPRGDSASSPHSLRMPSVARKAILERFVGKFCSHRMPGSLLEWPGVRTAGHHQPTPADPALVERLTEEGRQEVHKYRSEPVREQFSADHAYVPGRKLLCNAVIL
jgi:hypothetical protein